MSQEASAEALGTVDTVLSPTRCSLSCLEDEGQGSFLPWLVPDLPGPRWGTEIGVSSRSGDVEEETHLGACSQPGDAAAHCPKTKVHLVQAPGPGQDWESSPKATRVLPISAQGRTRSSRRLQNSLTHFLARGRPSTHCIVCRDPPERSRVLPQARSHRPREVEEGGKGTARCNGTRPPKRDLPRSPGPVRAQKESRRHECSREGKEEASGFLWLGGDTLPSAGLESLGGLSGPLSPGNTGLGPGDLSESWMEWALGAAEVGCFPPGGAQTGSPCSPAGCLLPGGEVLGEAPEGHPQSPALCLGGPGQASTEQRESEHRVPAGADEGPVTSLASGELEGPTQPVSRERLEQGLAATCTLVHCPEPAASKAPSGPTTGQRLSHSAETLRKSPELHAQDLGTGRNSNYSSTEQPGKRGARTCPLLMAAGPVIYLLGALGQTKAGWPQPLQLEPLEDLMEVSAASPVQRPRRKRRCKALSPPTVQSPPWEAEEEVAAEQDGREDAGQPSPDAGVRGTVVRALQKVLWSRLQELPGLVLSREAVEGIAVGIEAALFDLTQAANGHYKNKYRSLLFNLQDPRNPELFLKVLHGSVTPHVLVRMSSIQLAPQDLARWRDQEEKRGLELIEQLQQEQCRLPDFKMTHKGEVEILRDMDQTLTLEDLVGPAAPMLEDPAEPHKPRFPDPSSHIDMDPDPTREPRESLKAPSMAGNSIFQNILSPAPVCSPEMCQSGQKPPMEPQDRTQMPAGPAQATPSQPPWEGAVDMFSIKRFRANAQLVSGHSCRLVMALPEVIRSAGCIPSNTVWDLLASICPADAKDVCVVRLCPHGSRDVQNCRLLYSYLNSKQRHGLGAVEDMGVVLLPLPAFQPLPARLRPLGGPGLDITHSSLLLAVLLPKAKLPDTAESSFLKGKVRKTVSFSKRVELRCYQPETRKPVVAPEGDPVPQKHGARGSLMPRRLCSWQRPPGGRGRLWGEPKIRQRPEQGQCPPELHWSRSWHPCPGPPTKAGQCHGQNVPGASCPRQALLKYLESLVTMSRQLQASLGPDQVLAPPSSAVPAQSTAAPEILGRLCQLPEVPVPPALAPDSSLDEAEGAGPVCP